MQGMETLKKKQPGNNPGKPREHPGNLREHPGNKKLISASLSAQGVWLVLALRTSVQLYVLLRTYHPLDTSNELSD